MLRSMLVTRAVIAWLYLWEGNSNAYARCNVLHAPGRISGPDGLQWGPYPFEHTRILKQLADEDEVGYAPVASELTTCGFRRQRHAIRGRRSRSWLECETAGIACYCCGLIAGFIISGPLSRYPNEWTKRRC